MERIDISDDRRVADLVEAVERGDEVVIVRDGVVVAAMVVREPAPPPVEPRQFDLAALERFHAEHPMPKFEQSWGDLISQMRDEDDL
jgi:antitoxin (DNA-binding transcriptional repressor) of toxin-antitoxin stability system